MPRDSFQPVTTDRPMDTLKRRHAMTAIPSGAAPASGRLEPPQCLLDDLAVAEWHRVAPLLNASGALDRTHRSLLLGYCNSVAKAIRAEQILARDGRYYQTETPQGSMIRRRHPAIRDAEDGWNAVRRFARDLGLIANGALGIQNEARRAIFK